MEKYIVWYSLDHFEHLDSVCDVIDNINELKDRIKTINAITVEHYVGDKYIGETDYSVEDFLKYIEG